MLLKNRNLFEPYQKLRYLQPEEFHLYLTVTILVHFNTLDSH